MFEERMRLTPEQINRLAEKVASREVFHLEGQMTAWQEDEKHYRVYVVKQRKPFLEIVGKIARLIRRNTPRGVHLMELHQRVENLLESQGLEVNISTYGWRNSPYIDRSSDEYKYGRRHISKWSGGFNPYDYNDKRYYRNQNHFEATQESDRVKRYLREQEDYMEKLHRRYGSSD